MWTNFFDAASGSLCRGYLGLLGHLPVPCQVNAGRPAFVLTVVGIVLLIAAVQVLCRALRR